MILHKKSFRLLNLCFSLPSNFFLSFLIPYDAIIETDLTDWRYLVFSKYVKGKRQNIQLRRDRSHKTFRQIVMGPIQPKLYTKVSAFWTVFTVKFCHCRAGFFQLFQNVKLNNHKGKRKYHQCFVGLTSRLFSSVLLGHLNKVSSLWCLKDFELQLTNLNPYKSFQKVQLNVEPFVDL